MPRIARRLPLHRRQWSLGHLYYCETGFWFFRTDNITETDVRQCWEAWGDALTALHVVHCPGSRPWAWWRWTQGDGVPDELTQVEWLTRHRRLSASERARMRHPDYQGGDALAWGHPHMDLDTLRAWWREHSGMNDA